MDLKVVATASWHDGTPDGEHKVSFVIDEFDIHNQTLAIKQARQLLITYGVEEDQIYQDHTFVNGIFFVAEIARFDRGYPPHIKPSTSTQTVEMTFIYAWEHRGRIYDALKPNDEFNIISYSKSTREIIEYQGRKYQLAQRDIQEEDKLIIALVNSAGVRKGEIYEVIHIELTGVPAFLDDEEHENVLDDDEYAVLELIE